MVYQPQNTVFEACFFAQRSYADPFGEVCLDVVFADPDGSEQVVPAFWAGGDCWRVRFASPVLGLYRYHTVCSQPEDAGLHGQSGALTVIPYHGDNPLYQHGPLRVAANRRHLEHADGTPFFWLADTWWMGFTQRLTWPQGFQTLALDRVSKGFSAIQIVAGLYPDMPWRDERGANEAGFPWTEDFATINPAYFDLADRRLQYLVDLGLAPCVVACWGYFLPWMGEEKMQQHWRNLIARWGAYPVTWCLAGEVIMSYYLSDDQAGDRARQAEGWSRLSHYIKATDPFDRPLTAHPSNDGYAELADPSALDFDMLQTGHGDRMSLPNTVTSVTRAYEREPVLPVLNSEVCYEGIGEACRQEVQRMMFWVCLLSGACGHTYGANGIWQVNSRERRYGPSPHGMAWGNTAWEDACQLPGSRQVGLAKRLLERYPWERFAPHPEWVEQHWTEENYFGVYTAGIPGEVRISYFAGMWGSAPTVTGLEPGVTYRAFLWDPATGDEYPLGAAVGEEQGRWELPLGTSHGRTLPLFQDWVLVLDQG
ncbi:MAG TPA: DUF4038 domain-containing protein [Armatimonadota bacterium]|jgi:hypothetical protein